MMGLAHSVLPVDWRFLEEKRRGGWKASPLWLIARKLGEARGSPDAPDALRPGSQRCQLVGRGLEGPQPERNVHRRLPGGAPVRRAVHHRRRRPVLQAHGGCAMGARSVPLGVLALCRHRVVPLHGGAVATAADPLARSHAEAEEAGELLQVAAVAVDAGECLRGLPRCGAGAAQRRHLRLRRPHSVCRRDGHRGPGNLRPHGHHDPRHHWLAHDRGGDLEPTGRGSALLAVMGPRGDLLPESLRRDSL
eukprot:scaffold7340_cov266-Pinguiococcus_pyrenoidosus.AAC.67